MADVYYDVHENHTSCAQRSPYLFIKLPDEAVLLGSQSILRSNIISVAFLFLWWIRVFAARTCLKVPFVLNEGYILLCSSTRTATVLCGFINKLLDLNSLYANKCHKLLRGPIYLKQKLFVFVTPAIYICFH